MYRHDRVAAHAQIDCLRAQVGDLDARLAEAERARAAAEAESERLREGIGDDPELLSAPSYRRVQLGLRGIGAIGGAAFLVGASWLLAVRIADPLWTIQGLRNLWFHVRFGDAIETFAIAGGLALLLSPWLALPWIGAIGLRRQRRWGWTLAVVAAVLYLPTPLMPVAALALAVLTSGRVRALFFPR